MEARVTSAPLRAWVATWAEELALHASSESVHQSAPGGAPPQALLTSQSENLGHPAVSVAHGRPAALSEISSPSVSDEIRS
eukprot:3896902-Pleurochrysis_carterae.AAC.1